MELLAVGNVIPKQGTDERRAFVKIYRGLHVTVLPHFIVHIYACSCLQQDLACGYVAIFYSKMERGAPILQGIV